MEKHLMQTLDSFESDEDAITEFVKCKVESMIAQQLSSIPSSQIDSNDSKSFKSQSHKFHQVFAMPPEEKLVNCKFETIDPMKPYSHMFEPRPADYSCSYWKSHVPRQGWMYLSVNHLCFYSYILGKETKLVIKWVDVKVGADHFSLFDFSNMTF